MGKLDGHGWTLDGHAIQHNNNFDSKQTRIPFLQIEILNIYDYFLRLWKRLMQDYTGTCKYIISPAQGHNQEEFARVIIE